jgi:hypothetical protein
MTEGSEIPIDGEPMLTTAAMASVPPKRLPELLARVQSALGPRLASYEQSFECVCDDRDRAVFLVPTDHWEAVFDRLGFDRRERDAVRRAHNEQLSFLGSGTDRRDEFDAALEIRDAVCIGR